MFDAREAPPRPEDTSHFSNDLTGLLNCTEHQRTKHEVNRLSREIQLLPSKASKIQIDPQLARPLLQP